MTPKELRELDVLLAVNLFGWDMSQDGWSASAKEWVNSWSEEKRCEFGYSPESAQWKSCSLPRRVDFYTTDPAPAMEVLEKCCKIKAPTIFRSVDGYWSVSAAGIHVTGPTLEITLCLFAKKLFGKE